MISRLYAAIAWLIVALGMVHMAATFRLSGNPIGKIWFFGSGLAIALVGALNLLYRSCGRSCPGVRIVCRIANTFLMGLAIIAGVITNANLGERIVVWSLLIAAVGLSCLPARILARKS